MYPISAPSQDTFGVLSVAGASDADDGSPFSENIAVLGNGFPGDDREALRSFSAVHAVRRFDLTCILVIHAIRDIGSSNAQPLQSHEQPATLIPTLTVPAEFVYTRTRDARGGNIASGDLETVAERGQARTVDFAV